jgi:hypothetical protein
VSEQLDALAGVAADAQMRQFADNPKVRPQQVFDVIRRSSRHRCRTASRTCCAP